MIHAAYERIASAIEHSRGSQLIAVVVPANIPLLTATSQLQSSLFRQGIDVRCLQIRGQSDLLELVEAQLDATPPRAVIVHGLEGMPLTERESFLRATSFARSRLRSVPVPIILVLGEETWSLLGMELPDLARWIHGPFTMKDEDGDAGTAPRPLHIKPVPEILLKVSLPPDEHRNVDLDSAVEAWIERSGILVVGGPPGVGITSVAVRARERLRAAGRGTAWTSDELASKDGPKPLQLDSWLEEHRDSIVIIDRELADTACPAVQRRGMNALVLGSSRMALERPEPGITQLYVPPIQVVEVDGSPFPPGLSAVVRRIRSDVKLQLDIDVDAFLTSDQLELLGLASGGLPGLMWRLVADVEHRSRRLGFPGTDPTLIRTSIIDMSEALIAPFLEEEVELAIRHDLLDFELEARGAVLFYVIDGRLRTIRHPLLALARRLRAEA
jgi:hypothetical protein